MGFAGLGQQQVPTPWLVPIKPLLLYQTSVGRSQPSTGAPSKLPQKGDIYIYIYIYRHTLFPTENHYDNLT